MSTFPPDLFADRRFAVVGLGRAGLPAARALVAMGAEVVVWDDNEKAREAATGLTIQDLRGGGLEVDAIILSPGIHHRGVKAHPIAVRATASTSRSGGKAAAVSVARALARVAASVAAATAIPASCRRAAAATRAVSTKARRSIVSMVQV